MTDGTISGYEGKEMLFYTRGKCLYVNRIYILIQIFPISGKLY
jgi:hypothetical protein